MKRPAVPNQRGQRRELRALPSAPGGGTWDREPHPRRQRTERVAPSNRCPPRRHRDDRRRDGNELAFHDDHHPSSDREAERRRPASPGEGDSRAERAFVRPLRSFRGRHVAAKGQRPPFAAAFAASRTPRGSRKPVSPLASGPSSSLPFSRFGGRTGLGATPLHRRDGRPGNGRLLPPLLPRSGSLPARACGATDPCGKTSGPACGGSRGRPAAAP